MVGIHNPIIIRPPPHRYLELRNFQNTNSPDINFEGDMIRPEIDAEIALGMEAGELAELRSEKPDKGSKGVFNNKFQVNISTIIISALLFLVILAWFDFMQTTFYLWLDPSSASEFVPSSVKLWYALFVTVLVLILIILIYYYSIGTK